MSEAITVTVSVDNKLKRQAEVLCEEMGLTLSTVYTMLLKAIVRTRSIPFKIQAADPFYSERNQAVLMESIRELDAGLGQEHELIEDA
ncbi:MAG: type II toxin-antitoxin system RelB/DinJ family antitoxin [Synergistaceae bacterium]|nr:type II toxin-antitoxin system RelB/DinJ family antitoxin [Synergistaceae bacterium]